MIEQRIVGTGVRIGDGSLYDWVVEEILAGGDGGGEEVIASAMLLLAEVRTGRRRAITQTVERALALECPPRRRRPTGAT